MTPIEAERLAYAVNALRPDWPRTSLQTLLANAKLATRTLHDAAVAMVWIATDPATQTPGRVFENGPWWGATMRVASEAARHPSSVPFVPADEPCDLCNRTPAACREWSNGTHDYRPRHESKREATYRHGRHLVDAELAAALPPATDNESEAP